MGQAKRRTVEIEFLKNQDVIWRAGLSADELVIAKVAERLDERLVRGRQFTEGCYHLAFFMTHYLSLRGIAVTPVIGWVNDGEWEGMASHAWIEYKNKKTDGSLCRTSRPDAVPTGGLVIHDHILRTGRASYTYHKNDDAAVASALAWMETVPEWASVQAHKLEQHRQMRSIADEGRLDHYLSQAPAGLKYADIAALID